MPTRTMRTAVACLLLPLCLAAQEAQPVPIVAARQVRAEPVLVTLEFPGGTFTQFVDAVLGVVGKCNILLEQHADRAIVPPMQLRGVGLQQALMSTCEIVQGPVDLAVKSFGGPGESIYTIQVRERGGSTKDKPPEVVQRVFSLNGLTMPRGVGSVAPLAVESILSALEMVTGSDGNGPVLRYHKDSGLLLVRGTNEQVQNAMEALSVLADDLQVRNLWAAKNAAAGSGARAADDKGKGTAEDR